MLWYQGFLNGVSLWEGQFGQNDQKLHEDYKINIFGAKQWETWGEDWLWEDTLSPPHLTPLGEILGIKGTNVIKGVIATQLQPFSLL